MLTTRLNKIRNRINKSINIYSILIIGFLVRLFGILFNDLNEWDERFHALVSKNLICSPFSPTLISDQLMYLDPLDWSFCEIWLAKPPLSLWIMAFSMKLFGVNEIALRLPSLIFSTLSILLTYEIGKKLFNEKIGLYSAFFYAVNGLLYEINVGILSGDHVDTLFHLLCQISIYILISKSKFSEAKLGRIIGFLTGMAFLTKWTMAFFIILICAAYILFIKRNFKAISIFLVNLLLTFSIVILPWLIWICIKYDNEFKLILDGMFSPMTNVVQNHSGNWYYYINSIRIYINELVYIPLIFLIVKIRKRITKERFIIFIWIFIPLLLLSFSSTKREVYMMISASPYFITISLFIYFLEINFAKKLYFLKYFKYLFFIAAVRYSIERIKPMKSRLSIPEYRANMEKLISDNICPADSIILINEPKYVESRFYYNIKGYRYLDDSTINVLKEKGFSVYENVNKTYFKK